MRKLQITECELFLLHLGFRWIPAELIQPHFGRLVTRPLALKRKLRMLLVNCFNDDDLKECHHSLNAGLQDIENIRSISCIEPMVDLTIPKIGCRKHKISNTGHLDWIGQIMEILHFHQN